MDSKHDLKDIGLDEQAASFRKFYEAEGMDSLIRQFDAWIGDTERYRGCGAMAGVEIRV